MKQSFVWLAALAPLAWIAPPLPAWAQAMTDSGQASPVSEQKVETDISAEGAQASLKHEWQGRYRALLAAAAEANARYSGAKARYSKNRQRNTERGKARDEINSELRDAQIAKAKADAELADFPDLARRAGVEPGWLREVEDAPAAQLEGAAGR